ncbi:MAG: 4'-phosphopantetheinyl transferase family protein [Suipraeoptans sp.]
MIRTFIADISPLLDSQQYNIYYAKATKERKYKADRLKYVQDKAQSIGVYSLHQKIKNELGLSESHVYNYSHSGNYVLVCIADKSNIMIGCDIEAKRQMDIKVARRYYCDDEYSYVRSGNNKEEILNRFFRLWVLKESYMKAVRKGMGLSTKAFEIAFNGEDKPILVKQPIEFPGRFYYKEFTCIEGINIAVCSTDGEFDDIKVKSLEGGAII